MPARKSAIIRSIGVGLAQVDHLHVVRLPGGQDEGQIAGRLPVRLSSGGHGVEVEDIEADELDQGDALVQGQGHGAAVGGAELLLQVHLGDLPGQVRLQPFFLSGPLGQESAGGLASLRDRARPASSGRSVRAGWTVPRRLGSRWGYCPPRTASRCAARPRPRWPCAAAPASRAAHRFGAESDEMSEDQGQKLQDGSGALGRPPAGFRSR